MAFISTRMVSLRNLRLTFALSLLAIASSGCSKQQDTKEADLSRANDYFAAEQYDKAEKEYRDVLRLAPADPIAERQLGIIYYDQGQLPQAYSLLKKSAERQPDDLELQLKLGLTYLSARDYKQARDAALRILEKQPGNEQALLLLTDTAVAPNELEETRKTVENLRGQDQDRPGYHLALGMLDLRQKEEGRAENEFKIALNLDPKSAVAYMALGNLYWSRQDLKAADQAFKTAADLSPTRSPIRLRYADFKLRTGAAAEAKTMLEDISHKVPDYLPPRVYLMKMACAEHRDEVCATRVQNLLAQDPVNYDALFQDGILSLAKGDAPKAIRTFEYLSKAYSQNPQVRYQLALAYLLFAKSANTVGSQNALNGAEASLTEAIKLEPRFDQATLLLAELRIAKRTPTAAIDLLAPLTKERPQIAQAHYLLAAAYLAQQNADQALAVYRQMTELFPKDPQPPFLMGRILLEQRKLSDARKAFEKSVEISPDYLPAIETLVDLDIADKQYAAAIDRVQKQIDKDPKLAQAWALRGKIYLAQQDFTHAEPDLLKSIELDPNLQPSYLLLAQLYVATNKQEQAIEKLNASVEKNKTVPALMQLAAIHEQLKHYAEARDAYEKLLTVAPNFSPALNNLAVLYSEHFGQLDKAYDLAKKAREASPNEPHLADTLGWIAFKKSDYGNALPLLQESAGKLPDQPEIEFHVGMAHYMVGEEGPARIALQKAVDSSADFPGKDEARQRLAVLAIDVGTANAAARTELENYLRERPNDPAALVRLAGIQQRDGAVDQAVKTYEKVVTAYPLYAPATRQLALLLGQRTADDQRADDLLTKARQAYPDDPELAKTLGIINYRRGYYGQSAELLGQLVAKRADDPELLYYLGMSYYQLKRPGEAEGPLQRALGLNLPPKLADEARRALDDPELAKTRGISDYRSGHYAQSAELLKQVAAKHADDPELLYYLGMSYYQLKRPTEAKGPLQRALGMNLPPKLAEEATRALADCCKESN
jgi:tetratricopeptide (TPR) repeat protein